LGITQIVRGQRIKHTGLGVKDWHANLKEATPFRRAGRRVLQVELWAEKRRTRGCGEGEERGVGQPPSYLDFQEGVDRPQISYQTKKKKDFSLYARVRQESKRKTSEEKKKIGKRKKKKQRLPWE